MKRILVIGCCGAGKSHLTKRLTKGLGLPAVHLDQLYWQPGWEALPREEFVPKVEAACAEEGWVMDGNFRSTLELRLARAEGVVLFDFPTWRCIWGALRRLISRRGQVRSDMGEGCPEGFDADFYRWIWRFRKDELPPTLEILEQFPQVKVWRVRNRREVEEVRRELIG